MLSGPARVPCLSNPYDLIASSVRRAVPPQITVTTRYKGTTRLSSERSVGYVDPRRRAGLCPLQLEGARERCAARVSDYAIGKDVVALTLTVFVRSASSDRCQCL